MFKRSLLIRSTSSEHTVVRIALTVIVAVLAGYGCAAPDRIQRQTEDAVRTYSVPGNRYTVYYQSPGSEKAARQQLDVVFGEGRGQPIVFSGNQNRDPGQRVNSETDESDDQEAKNQSPGFEEFQDEYKTAQEEQKGTYDPLEGFNRFMFQVNDNLYIYFLKPAAQGWKFVVPEPARNGLDRAFTNVVFPIRFANSLFQLKFEESGSELGRFVVNTTIGIGGIFDPAKHWFSLKPSKEDFGQTLGHHGVGHGFPLTLPILGPSNLRDALGKGPDYFLNPLHYVNPWYVESGLLLLDRINSASIHILGVYDSQKEEALDPYTFFRDAYHQNRNEKIKN